MRDAGLALARRAVAATVAAVALVAGLGAVAGCAARAGASQSIEVATAYVPVPQASGTTVAYVVIRNNGSADRLVAAHTSAATATVVATARRASASPAARIRSLPRFWGSPPP